MNDIDRRDVSFLIADLREAQQNRDPQKLSTALEKLKKLSKRLNKKALNPPANYSSLPTHVQTRNCGDAMDDIREYYNRHPSDFDYIDTVAKSLVPFTALPKE